MQLSDSLIVSTKDINSGPIRSKTTLQAQHLELILNRSSDWSTVPTKKTSVFDWILKEWNPWTVWFSTFAVITLRKLVRSGWKNQAYWMADVSQTLPHPKLCPIVTASITGSGNSVIAQLTTKQVVLTHFVFDGLMVCRFWSGLVLAPIFGAGTKHRGKYKDTWDDVAILILTSEELTKGRKLEKLNYDDETKSAVFFQVFW